MASRRRVTAVSIMQCAPFGSAPPRQLAAVAAVHRRSQCRRGRSAATSSGRRSGLVPAAGHAARPAFYFVVASPGTVAVRVEPTRPASPSPSPLYAGTSAVQRAQGEKDIRLTVNATPELLANGHEWAVVVSGSTPSTTGDGRITVEAPGLATPRPASIRWTPGCASIPPSPFISPGTTRGRVASYSAWPDDMRAALRTAFDDPAGRPGARVPDPPPNAWRRSPATIRRRFTPRSRRTSARALYLGHRRTFPARRHRPSRPVVARRPQRRRARRAAREHVAVLVERRATGLRDLGVRSWMGGAGVAAGGLVLPGPERLLKPTRLDTVIALVGWARGLTHFAGPVSRDNFRDHWGYDGDMPVSRALAGTRYTGVRCSRRCRATIGCATTPRDARAPPACFASVLRAANIPVRPRSVSNDSTPHATVLFLSEDRALTHGDDPYSLLVEGADPRRSLIDLDTYTKWLGPGSKDAGRYIGRQALAVGLARLPSIVRRTHERDRQQGLAPEQSGVFSLFKGSYFMAELQEARLWERLEETGVTTRLADGSMPGAVVGHVAGGRNGPCLDHRRIGRRPRRSTRAPGNVAQSAAAAVARRPAGRRTHAALRDHRARHLPPLDSFHPRAGLRHRRMSARRRSPRPWIASAYMPRRWSPQIR